ncbi:hypothetical protein LTR91_001033 [Friedmanniomyces endolithicus]|nr:hypothetical protein LTS09_015829 [Friedmanniomyces endolithicus]KAK0307506.1 hypothetical protein LTR01_005506 [Friedmanniomyces endolithicus]KAK0314292.1 hypothetical protein LTR82_013009 [Friedmanniomyces endolithicus]KAK0920172.1 hypothetical protein LTR57_010036 [Friedmanniomyces endolithicus]KAK1011470.1 hypothetical protein LTS01_001326 [Friedmanniomyces endolithicus]
MPSLYDMSIPMLVRALERQQALMKIAEKHCEDKKVSPETLLKASLAEDMKPFPFQIQTISNTAKFVAVRVGGLENEPWEDNETTFAQLHERLEKTLAFLKKAKPEQFEGKDDAEVTMKAGTNEFKFTSLSYLQVFAIPNFFFHHMAAYAILRNQGVPVGKFD